MPDVFTPEQIAQILEAFFDAVGTRQYIGARYVPIFGRKNETSILWDNSAPYEPLTVVLYQGNSFTSRQYVPAGVEITNEEFWAETGNFNAQVEEYRRIAQASLDEARAAQNDINTLLPKDDFSSTNTVKKYIDDSIAEVNNDIDDTNALLPASAFDSTNTVQAAITNANAAIAANTNSISTFNRLNLSSGAVAIAFGDSITHGYGLTNPATENWFYRLCNNFGWECHNFAVDSAAYTRVSNSIIMQVENAHNDTSFADSDVNVVFISGGINDRNAAMTDIEPAIANVINKVRQYFTNAKIYAIPCLANSYNLNNFQQGDDVYYHQQVVLPIVNYFKQFTGVYTFTNAWAWLNGITAWTQSDGIHPSRSGAQVICNCVASALMGCGEPRTVFYYSGDFIISDEIIDRANSKYWIVSNGFVWHVYGYMMLRAGQTIPAAAELFPCGGITQYNQGNCAIPFILLSDATPNMAPGFIRNRSAFNHITPIVNSSQNDKKIYFDVCGSVGV